MLPDPKAALSRPGQGMLEFAIILPLLLVILAAIADLGIMYLTAQTIQHASREGARFAVKLGDLSEDDARVSDYVEAQIPDIDLYSSFNSITTAFPGCDLADEVTVTVAGEYNFLALNLIGLESIPLSLSTTMRYESCGFE